MSKFWLLSLLLFWGAQCTHAHECRLTLQLQEAIKQRGALELFKQAILVGKESDELLDEILGLDVQRVCENVQKKATKRAGVAELNGHPVWQNQSGMHQSSYLFFHKVFQKLAPKNGDLVVDIGSGFSRLGFYLAVFFPQVRFKGFELVGERVAESKRVARELGIGANIEFIEQDLSAADFSLPIAQFYYTYTPVNERTGNKLWNQLHLISKKHPFLWIYNGLKGGIETESWLSLVDVFNEADVYRSIP